MLNWMWWMPRPPVRPDPTRTFNINFNHNLVMSGELTLKLVPAPIPLRAAFTIWYEGRPVKGLAPMAYTLPDDKQVSVKVSFLDASGHDVDLPQGNVTWETSDDMICNVGTLESDDQSAMLNPGKNLGNAQITCTGKNDDGSSVIATLDVTVVGGDAVTGSIQPQGEPQPLQSASTPQSGQRSGQHASSHPQQQTQHPRSR